MKKRILSALLALAMVSTCLVGCGGNKSSESKSSGKVTKITIQSPTTNVAPGKKIKLKATVTPAKAANKAVTWSTSNSKYATVDKNGTVAVNKKAGGKTVTITATAKDGSKKKASIKIKIAKGEVKKIKITGKKTVNAGNRWNWQESNHHD